MNEFISNLILKFFPISSMPYWMVGIIIFVIAMSYTLFKTIPRIIENNIKQKNEYKSAHQLQIESYFRDVSGAKIEDLFLKWTDALISQEAFLEFLKNQKNVDFLIRNTIMYGSNRTIKIAASFMQFSFINSPKFISNEDDYNENIDKTGYYEFGLTGLAYLAVLICSLKSDFSGYDVVPQLILELKYKDWEDIKDQMIIYLDKIEKQVGL